MSRMPVVPTLSDGTVTLRAPVDDDIEGSWEQCQDPLSRQWTTAPVPYTREDARAYLRHIIPGGWETHREWGFVVQAVDDDGRARFAGTVSLRNLGDGRVEVAYGSHPWARGRRVMERALRLLLDWGFAEREVLSVPTRGDLVDAWVGTLRRGEELAPRHPWPHTPTIIGEHVVLRPTTDADIPRLVEAANDPVIQVYSRSMRVAAPHDDATMRARELGLREENARGAAVFWTVADPEDDRLLGWMSLFDLSPAECAEVGYWTHPGARRRGVAQEACRMAVRHAFVDTEDGGLGLRRLRADVAEVNEASHRIVEAAGFRRIGLERQGTLLGDGSYVDTVLYDLLVTD
jgi:RimJ/RimL family protein N-acetyltransferase